MPEANDRRTVRIELANTAVALGDDNADRSGAANDAARICLSVSLFSAA
jgi:hypothetical protein